MIETLPPLPGGLLTENEEREIERMLNQQNEIDIIWRDVERQAKSGLLNIKTARWAMEFLMERLGNGHGFSQPN